MDGKRKSCGVRKFFRRLLIAPLALCAVLDGADMDILVGAVDKRTARAEAAVLRDYFAQHGIEGEQAEQAEQEYRRRRREMNPDAQTLAQLRQRAEQAEQDAVKASVSAEARVQLARLGVPERNSADVLLLASEDLEAARQNGGDPEAVRQTVRHALESVVARLPGLAEPTGSPAGTSAGARGNFPRSNDAALTYQQSLDRARAAGDNAAAVSIITAAAARGIALR